MRLIKVPKIGKRYRAELKDDENAFFAVLSASSENYLKFGKAALSSEEKIARDLGTVYNALINESFDWVFAHMNPLSEAFYVKKSLFKAEFVEFSPVYDRLFLLYCTYNLDFEGVPRADLSADAALSEMEDIQKSLYQKNAGEDFLNQANAYCVANYDWPKEKSKKPIFSFDPIF